jgi:hypothetical protein
VDIFARLFRILAEIVICITFFFIFLNYVISKEKSMLSLWEMYMSFLNRVNRFKRVFVWCALLFIAVIVLNGPAGAASLYRYVDEDGNVTFTDDPSNPRYKYTPVRTFESEQKNVEPENAEKAKPETTKAAPKGGLTPEEVTEKERIVNKIAQLEKIKSETDNVKYQEMLQSELDMLNDQLKELNKKSK